MLSFLLNCFCNGAAVPDIQILSSASRSKVPAVSMLKCVMLFVRNRVVLHLASRDSLLVDKNEALVHAPGLFQYALAENSGSAISSSH